VNDKERAKYWAGLCRIDILMQEGNDSVSVNAPSVHAESNISISYFRTQYLQNNWY